MYIKSFDPHDNYSEQEVEEHIQEFLDYAREVIHEFKTDEISAVIDGKYLHYVLDKETSEFLDQDNLPPELHKYKFGFLLHFSQMHSTTDTKSLLRDMDEFSQAANAYYM